MCRVIKVGKEKSSMLSYFPTSFRCLAFIGKELDSSFALLVSEKHQLFINRKKDSLDLIKNFQYKFCLFTLL